MSNALAFFSEFNPSDRSWLFETGQEQELLATQTLCSAGDMIECIYVVMQGLLGVHAVHADGSRDLLGRVGAGEIIGETSWLTGQPVTATVEAEEATLVLRWTRQQLGQRLDDDASFAASFYRALAAISARRLGDTIRVLRQTTASNAGESRDTHVPELNAVLREIKTAIAAIDKKATQNDGEISPEDASSVMLGIDRLAALMKTLLGSESPYDKSTRDEIGASVRCELLPYIALTATMDRMYAKPRGYAGDYLTIAMMYEDKPSGHGRIGALIDACFLSRPAPVAVRNRRKLLKGMIEATIAGKNGEVAQVTSFACGPAAEIFDVYDDHGKHDLLRVNLLDIDLQALAHVADIRDRRKLGKHIQLFSSNLIHLATGRQSLSIPPQDLIYSIGLIDYFADAFVISLMNFAHDLLAPGGRLVLGNFHPRNPDKEFMDHALEWPLIHRTEADMDRLFAASKFAKPCDAVTFEEQQINLFAECSK